jgi:hypothetical protein
MKLTSPHLIRQSLFEKRNRQRTVTVVAIIIGWGLGLVGLTPGLVPIQNETDWMGFRSDG